MIIVGFMLVVFLWLSTVLYGTIGAILGAVGFGIFQ